MRLAPEPPLRRRRWLALLALPALAVAAFLVWSGAHPAAADRVALSGAAPYVDALERHVATEPRDGRAWVLLARAYMEGDDFEAAARAYAKALQVAPRVARDPGVLCEAADAIGMAQGGDLAGRPSELIAAALAIDGRHPVALEMAGSAAVAQQRFADAVTYWSAALEQLPPGSPRHRELAAAIEAAQRRAAVSSYSI